MRRRTLVAAALSVATLLLGVALLAGGVGRVDLLAEGPEEAPSSLSTAGGTSSSLSLNPIDDALLTGDELTVSGPDGSEGKDRVGTTLAQVKTKLARETQLWNTDKISEAELAGRLSRAIDQHEKCRRHWPHLEKLEAAQEVSLLPPRPPSTTPPLPSPQLGLSADAAASSPAASSPSAGARARRAQQPGGVEPRDGALPQGAPRRGGACPRGPPGTTSPHRKTNSLRPSIFWYQLAGIWRDPTDPI